MRVEHARVKRPWPPIHVEMLHHPRRWFEDREMVRRRWGGVK
jgi:hypothetical protein